MPLKKRYIKMFGTVYIFLSWTVLSTASTHPYSRGNVTRLSAHDRRNLPLRSEYATHQVLATTSWRTKESWNCDQGTVGAISTTITTMRWSTIYIFYETSDVHIMSDILIQLEQNHTNLKVTMYDVSGLETLDVVDVLSKICVEQGGQSAVPLLLILRNIEMLKFLTTVNELDLNSNKTTNYKTKSFSVIVTDDPSIRREFLSWHFNLKNVLLLHCNGNQLYPATLSDDTKYIFQNIVDGIHGRVRPTTLYPNSNYEYSRRHLVIGVIESTYMRRQADGHYTGFMAEMTHMIAEDLNFTYTFIESPDHKYGSRKQDGSWKGLVGLLERYEVDIVVADLTITEDRLRVIDYIFPPFIRHSFGIVYRHGATKRDSSWLKIFRPLHLHVYALIFAAIVFLGLLLLVTERDVNFSQNKSSKSAMMHQLLSNIITLLGFLSVRGDGMCPKQNSSSIIVAFFWCFCTVVAAVYIGNLTAKLTDTDIKPPFNSVEELMQLSDWKFGLQGDTLSQAIVQHTNNTLIQQVWRKITEFNRSDPSVLNLGHVAHMAKVQSSDKYAFLLFNAVNKILRETVCTFATVGGVIPDLSLAIAVSKNSYLRGDLERIMGRITDSGLLQFWDMKSKYTVQSNHLEHCNARETVRPLQTEDILGSFLVLSAGTILAVTVLLFEFVIKRYQSMHK